MKLRHASLFFFVLLALTGVQALDVNVFEPVTVPGDGNYFRPGANVNITFSVKATDLNLALPLDVNARLSYSATAHAFTNLITSPDLNLMAACGDTNLNNTRTCTYSWTIPAVSDGNYFVDINAFVFDRNAATILDVNASTSSRSFFLDANSPVLGIDYNAAWQKTDANITLSCSDTNGSGCTELSYVLDTDATSGVSFGNRITFSTTTTSSTNVFMSADGNYALDVNATDRAGNSTNKRVYVLIDKNGPVITTDANTGWQSFDANVQITISDANAIAQAWIIKDGVAAQSTGPFSGLFAVFNSDGNHSLDVNATDYLGNVTVKARQQVLVDKTAPAVPSLSSPVLGDGQLTVTWTGAGDNLSGIKEYRVYLNSELTATLTGSTYTQAGLTNGTSYSFTIRAVDNAGNVSGESAAVSGVPQGAVTDSEAPSILIVDPKDEAVLTGLVEIRVGSTAADIARVEYYLNSTLIARVTEKSNGFYRAELDTLLYANGGYELKAIATDTAGNTSTSTRTVSIDNAERNTGGGAEIVPAEDRNQATRDENTVIPEKPTETGAFSTASLLVLAAAIIIVGIGIAWFAGGKDGFSGVLSGNAPVERKRPRWANRT